MLKRVTRYVTLVNRGFLLIAIVILVVLALFMTGSVVMRYVFDAPVGWSLDVSRALFAYVVFFALGPTLQNRKHVSMDLVYDRVPDSWKYWMKTVAWMMVISFSFLLLWKVGEHAVSAFETGRRFTGSWAVEAKYIYISAPIGVAQMLITALVGAYRHIAKQDEVPVWPQYDRDEGLTK